MDGDKALDLVRTTSMKADRSARGRTSRSGALVASATVENFADAKLAGGQLVVAGETRQGAMHYGCLGADFLVKIAKHGSSRSSACSARRPRATRSTSRR